MLDKFLSDIGKLDRKITLRKENTVVKDDYGHKQSATYTDKSIFAALSFANKDEEDIDMKQSQIEVLHFIIRYEVLGLKDQIVYDNSTYDIINKEEIGRKRFLKIKCRKLT